MFDRETPPAIRLRIDLTDHFVRGAISGKENPRRLQDENTILWNKKL